MGERRLTIKQRLWVEAVIAGASFTDAARQAGYKGNSDTLKQVGSENFAKPYLAKLIEKRVEDAIITADEILMGVKEIALSSEKDADRLKAYDLLGKHLAMWTERTQHEGGIKISVLYADPLGEDE